MHAKQSEAAEEKLRNIFAHIKKSGMSENEIAGIASKLLNVTAENEIKVPITVFNNDYLSSLENIVKYLRENLLLSFRQIGELTNRNQIALAVTYRNAKKKLGKKFAITEISPYSIPVTILQNRNLSVLENVVAYLKDSFSLTYHAIAVLLNRDDRTIWTVYQRAEKKRK